MNLALKRSSEHDGDLTYLNLGRERVFLNHVVAEQLIEYSNRSICRPCIFRFARALRQGYLCLEDAHAQLELCVITL